MNRYKRRPPHATLPIVTPSPADMLPCELCGRRVSDVSKHHLVPRSEGGELTVDLCGPCHKTLHSFFTNRTLARELSSLEAIREHPDVQRYLAWIRKRPDHDIRVRMKRGKR